MTTALGDECITKKLFSDELGSATKPIDTAYITNIVPPPGGGANNLQEVLDGGNSATQDILLNGTYQIGTLPVNPDAEIATFPNGAGTNLIFRNQNSGGAIDNALVIRPDGTFSTRTAIIETDNIDADEVRIGKFTNTNPVGNESVNIGENCGENAGIRGVHIGWKAGQTAGTRAVAIGDEAGNNNIGTRAVAIGQKSMENGGGADAICIGSQSGQTSAGTASIAIGRSAGQTQLNDNCIVLNASGADRSTTSTGKFYVDPIDSVPTNQNGDDILFYNSASKEVYVDRQRFSINTQFGASGSTYTMASDERDVLILRWVSGGAGTWTVNLPNASFVRQGTRFVVKNYTQTSGQEVAIVPNGTNTIDGSNLAIRLPATPRLSSGGGGSSVELMLVDSGVQWIVLNSYNGTY